MRARSRLTVNVRPPFVNKISVNLQVRVRARFMFRVRTGDKVRDRTIGKNRVGFGVHFV